MGNLILIGLSLEIVKLILAFSLQRIIHAALIITMFLFVVDLIIFQKIGFCTFSKESAYIVAFITLRPQCA